MPGPNHTTMQHGLFKGIYLVMHGEAAPGNDEWNAYLAAMNGFAKDIRRNFVFTLGGSPNAAQRKATADMWLSHGKMPPTSVISPSAFTRGVVTALNWLVNNALTAYSPAQFAVAVNKLELRREDYPALCTELSAMAERLGLPKRFAVGTDGDCIVRDIVERVAASR